VDPEEKAAAEEAKRQIALLKRQQTLKMGDGKSGETS